MDELSSRVYLRVPFNEKDECKSLGGKWDPNEKKWFFEITGEIVKFYKWLPTGNDLDVYSLTIKILQTSLTWQKIISKIENIKLYPVDLQRMAHNAAEYCDFGQCISISTSSDNNKYAIDFMQEFKKRYLENETLAIEWLQSRMITTVKKRYQKYSNKE